MMNFRPIATAPTDGTPFLGYCPDGVRRDGYAEPPGIASKFAICWNGHPNDDQPRGLGWVSADVKTEVFGGSELTGTWNEYEWTPVTPTHWLPLWEPK